MEAGGRVIQGDGFGAGRLADRHREGAARGEAATRWRAGERWWRTFDGGEDGFLALQVRKGVHESHRVGMRRSFQDRPGGAMLHHAPGIHHRDLLAEIGDHADIVGHDDRGKPQLRAQRTEGVENLALHDHVQRGDRLVGDHQLRPQRQRQGDGGALAHATAELVRIVCEALRMQANRPEHLGRPCIGFGTGKPAAVAQHLPHLVAQAVDRVQGAHRGLWHEGDLPPQAGAPLRRRQGHEVRAVQQDLPAGYRRPGRHHPHQGAGQGGLATA